MTANVALTWRDLQTIYSGSTGKPSVSPCCSREIMGGTVAHKVEWWLLLGGEIIEGCLEEEALWLIDSHG